MKTQKRQKIKKELKDFFIIENCLEALSGFTKQDLLNEIQQLLLAKTDKGEDLKALKQFYQQGGLRGLK
tara:strand:+ start:303 stop:509 length:207 start_codon:yes stop_codon:yes gene_type:complete